MSSSSYSVQRSQRKKKRRVVLPRPVPIITGANSRSTTRSKRHGRKAMAARYVLRSRNYVRQNSDELVINNTSHLIRRPLSISSSTSSSSSVDEGDGSGDVVDLTRDRGIGDHDGSRASRREPSHGPMQSGASGQSGSTFQGRNVVIIDSDEDVLEMEMPPTPPHQSHSHQTHTHTRNLKKQSNQSKTGSGSSSSDLVCCEDLPSTDSTPPSDKPSPVKNISPSKISSRSIIQCPICMETVQQFEKEGRQLMVTRCGHIFCSVCIRESAKAQRRCPSCRKPVSLRGGFHELFIS